ncbi:hypothetical protein FNW02_36185 [Komarekiella sp. 'clone 1']|uniref:Uncharacterized protein n=1 Tax=Komarekiella delphini-convector SJRDD-AB1 TaxID=2593771 RepID=A0AA40VVF7_9NOST|nr:hypothetical protein [Komarekiella delphini-convector]MBD6621022.1 hypothetical protein [Komarekiella delphini-convector SJRDD-AB1]
MIIPFDLLRTVTSTDGRRCIIGTAYAEIIGILHSEQEAFIDYELRGTFEMIAEGGAYSGEVVYEFLTEILQDLRGWGYVEEVESDELYWVLTSNGVLLKQEIAGF